MKTTAQEIIDEFTNSAKWTYTGIWWDKESVKRAVGAIQSMIDALKEIAELEGDCEQQKFRLTRFQASQVARAALAKCALNQEDKTQ